MNGKFNKTIFWCLIFLLLMVAFTIALVPLYNTFCQITGLNGKIDLNKSSELPSGETQNRLVTVEFIVNYHQDMPWEFKPQHKTLKIKPGELIATGYFATNKTEKTIIAQAIPSISPFYAAPYFKKVVCFCFSQQVLGPGQSTNLPLQFYLDNNLPKKITHLTLAYTLFNITDGPPNCDCIPKSINLHEKENPHI